MSCPVSLPTGIRAAVAALLLAAMVARGFAQSCLVDWNNVHQRIDGFGASSAFSWFTWTPAQADMFFSTNSGTGQAMDGSTFHFTGIGLSLLSSRVVPGGTTAEGTIMQLARDRGAQIWSVPSSPAITFKTTNANGVLSPNGGNFDSSGSNYQAYANQLAGYVVDMQNSYGVTLYALSVQNEPDYVTTNYESCGWSAQQIHDFVPYLSAALAARNVSATRIMLPESASWSANTVLYTTTMSDLKVAPLVSIIANHDYVANNNVGDQLIPAALNTFGKPRWETSVSTVDAFDGGITNALYWAKRIHQFLTFAQVNAWHYWWLITLNPDNGGLADMNWVPAKRMYALGQWSRFVRPNYYRIDASASGVLASAFKDPGSANFALVIVNQSQPARNMTFNFTNCLVAGSVTPWITSSNLSLAPQTPVPVNGTSFNYTIPAQSVVTFAGQARTNVAPVPTPIADQTTGAGITLMVTNTATDANVPPLNLNFSLLSRLTNATLDAVTGLFTWRPMVSQANSTNLVTVVVSDSGVPPSSATNSFNVVVSPLTPISLGAVTASTGHINLLINGPQGPDYTLLSSTDLSTWSVQSLIASPTLPLRLQQPIATNIPAEFFRIQIGP
jgi:glucuronoarabinoxylan endo-1,4-beta-xylanase